jgi:acyl-CoA thioesterase-2
VIYGGQLMAQALHVAGATLGEARPAHYLQTSFIAGGDPAAPLDFEVRVLRDGKSTSNRQVEISQGGETLLLAALSFQAASGGYDHQVPMPGVDDPDDLLSTGRYLSGFSDEQGARFPFYVLECPPGSNAHDPVSSVWTKPRFEAGGDTLMQQMLYTFVSDTSILQSALQPHALQWDEPGLVVATMNHSLWFHRPFDINEWLLMHSVSPSTNAGRAFSTANTFTRDGTLVATIAQEGILRQRRSQ